MRDFLCFESTSCRRFRRRARCARRRRRTRRRRCARWKRRHPGDPAGLVRAPDLLSSQPAQRRRPGGGRALARVLVCARLRTGIRLLHRNAGKGRPARARPAAHLRLHDLQRRFGARRADPGNAGQLGPGRARTSTPATCSALPRDGRRAQGPVPPRDVGAGQRRRMGRGSSARCGGGSRTASRNVTRSETIHPGEFFGSGTVAAAPGSSKCASSSP